MPEPEQPIDDTARAEPHKATAEDHPSAARANALAALDAICEALERQRGFLALSDIGSSLAMHGAIKEAHKRLSAVLKPSEPE